MPIYLVYMLQQVEYSPNAFLRWVVRIPDLRKVMHRQQLEMTMKAGQLVLIGYFIWLFYLVGALYFATISLSYAVFTVVMSSVMTIIWLYFIVLFAWLYVEEPRRRSLLKKAEKLFAKHPGVTIAVTGSYGKTSIKELLATVLSSSKKVASTPGNKNVPISQSKWITNLDGDEDILLVEFGEGAPGDIKKMAKLTHPDIAIIAGLAPNHLDQYKTLDAVAKDFISLNDFVKPASIFYNSDDATLSGYISDFEPYGHQAVMGWKISGIKIDIGGTSFGMKMGKKYIKIHSGLLGRHNVGPLALSAALAERLGVPIAKIESAIKTTEAYEHRMQPRQLSGAWIIDDTYNGNLEGIKAGLDLLQELPAKRKIYVTPGLVDQGEETKRVHQEIGEAIAAAKPDRVILMHNSVCHIIESAMKEHGYKGELIIEPDPLSFYSGLEHTVAAGDLVVLQNDWTDNYE